MTRLKGGKIALECLKEEKVTTIFGYPGGAILPFYDDIYDYANDIRHVLTRHEQGAVHAAEGYARASGKVGVCISTSGPGATNLATGLADAYLDSVPLVAISGQVSTEYIGNDAFQEADIYGMTMAITKHNFKILSAEEIPLTMKRAFYIATHGRPGPVHIDFPKDLQNQEIEFVYPTDPKLRGYRPQTKPHPIQVSKAVDLIISSERPVILAGGGVIISNAHQELFMLAETLLVPVVTTLMGKGAFPETHPLFLGQPGMHGRYIANYALHNADLIIAVGTRFDDRVTASVKTFAPVAKIIHIDIDSAEIGKNIDVTVPIVGDAKSVLRALLEELAKLKSKANQTEWRKRIHEVKDACECDYNYSSDPIKPQTVMHLLNKYCPKNTIFTTEVGQHQMFAMHFLRIQEPRRFISSGGLGTMGFGLPAAIGAKAARPNDLVIDIAGDGSIVMTSQEFATSYVNNLPVLVIVLNNYSLGMVKQWQKLFYKKRYSHVDLRDVPDLIKLAEAYGGNGISIERHSQLEPALKEVLQKELDVFTLIEIKIDTEEDMFPMVPSGGSNAKMIPSRACTRVAKSFVDNSFVPLDALRTKEGA